MSVTTDIFGLWLRPGEIFRPKLAQGPREDRALAVVMAACLLNFVAQWPRLARQAHEAHDAAVANGTPLAEVPDVQALIGTNLFAMMFLAPLLLYGIAALSHLVARLFGAQMQPFATRLALFWALLAASPLLLLHGLVAAFVGPGAGLSALSVITLGAFLWLWGRLLREAVRHG